MVTELQKGLENLLADDALFRAVEAQNPWFLPPLVKNAIHSLRRMTEPEEVREFLHGYPVPGGMKRVGIIMAGNVPLVGFHDLLMVLLAGHEAVVKLSSRDSLLLPALIQACSPAIRDRVRFTPQLFPEEIDCLLSTGSDNSARYISHQFGKLPVLLRMNRFSVAVLKSGEDEKTLRLLADDILLYHGMGCRSVSTVLLPEGKTLGMLIPALEQYPSSSLSADWRKVVSWERAEAGVRAEEVWSCRNILIRKETELKPARVGCLHIVTYRDDAQLQQLLASAEGRIQCVVSSAGPVEPGQTQQPSVSDFADGVDVLKWLAAERVSRKPDK